jgi:hypothetical protein
MQFHQTSAMMACLFETCLAIRAHHPLNIHPPAASRAVVGGFDSVQESFLFQCLLIFLFKSSVGSEDEIDEYSGEEKNSDDQDCQDT